MRCTECGAGQFADGIKKNFTSEDIRFTQGRDYLYATALKCSEDGNYCIHSLGEQDASRAANFHGIIRKVEVLGAEEAPVWRRDAEGLHIFTEKKSSAPIVFRILVE